MYPRCNYRNLSLSSSVVYKERLIQIKIQFKRCLLFLPPPLPRRPQRATRYALGGSDAR